jgi:hypothetical protein
MTHARDRTDSESTNAFIKTEANVQYEWRGACRSHLQCWNLLEPDLNKYFVHQLNLKLAHRRRMQSNLFAVFAPTAAVHHATHLHAQPLAVKNLKQFCHMHACRNYANSQPFVIAQMTK